MPKYKVPAHIDYGKPEDTYNSCLSLVPKPPWKNTVRQLANFSKKLRYFTRMDAVHPEDKNRDFILEYDLSNGTIQISEIKKRNSGRQEGCFLSWRLIPKPITEKDDPLYYTPEDFFIGARINIFNHRFVITGADLFVYHYIEENSGKFCQEVRENLRSYFLQQNMLQNDIDIEAKKIKETKDEQELLADNMDVKVNKNDVDTSKWTGEFDMTAIRN